MINNLPSPITKKKMVRRGRGFGTGKGGHTVGRGTKGQKSRSGYSRPRPGFEGGQMPLSRRLPKLKGFSRGKFELGKKHYVLQLSEIVEVVEGSEITPETVVTTDIVNDKSRVLSFKIVYDKDITKKVTIDGIAISKRAAEAVEKAGGKIK